MLSNKIRQYYYSYKFSRSCHVVKGTPLVQGPVVVFGGGRIEVGQQLVVRSRNHNQVEIYVAKDADLRIGNRVFLNQGVRISCSQAIQIGDGCLIADETVIMDSDFHGTDASSIKQAPIVIEDNVWIAMRAIVLRGVTVGEGSIIGAGSVVTRSIHPRTFAAGIPARPIRTLDKK